jgi:hypothetical protein
MLILKQYNAMTNERLCINLVGNANDHGLRKQTPMRSNKISNEYLNNKKQNQRAYAKELMQLP